MKLLHASSAGPFGRAVVVAIASAITLASIAACNPRQKRTDWRSPAARTACASDSDCPNGTCTIEPGAPQGMCSPAALPPLPGGDGGTRPAPPPGPNVQPSPSDIQI